MISKNLAQAIVLTAPSPATSGTSLVVRSGEGAYFHNTPPFLATAAPADQLANPGYAEIVLVTAISTDTLTIVRAKRGTTAKSIAAGWIIANGIYTENVLGVDVTVSTAAATATKVGTTTAGDYTPTLGDVLNVTFSNGNTVTTPTLNIDGSGAKNIRLGNANVTTAFFNTGSAITLRLWYDGTYYQMYGSLLNTDTTYSEISQAEITNTASTTTRLITGRRAEDLMANEATKARTLASKTLTSPVINTGVSGTAIDTDGTLAANSDTKLASQKATKTYVDSKAGVNSLIRNEVPGGTVNGSNTAFTLASTPATNSLRLHKNGIRLKITDDYTLSGTTITMVSAPLTNDKLLADYETTSSVYSVGTNSIIVGEVPSGSVNGSNATFTLARAYIAGSVEVFINGVAQARTTHFTETTPASGIITMSDAPLTGDIITVNYQYNLNPSSNADTVDGIHANATATANQLMPLDSNGKFPVTLLTNPYRWNVYRNAALSNTAGTTSKVTFDTEVYDTNNNFASGTYTVPVKGVYDVNARVSVDNSSDVMYIILYKNGAQFKRGGLGRANAEYNGHVLSTSEEFNAGDTLEIYVYTSGTRNFETGSAHAYFNGKLAFPT